LLFTSRLRFAEAGAGPAARARRVAGRVGSCRLDSPPRNAKVGRAGLMKAARWVASHSLNMDFTSSSGPGQPAARSKISLVETASPSAGFSYDAFRLGVSCRQAQGRRLSDSCLKAVNGQDDARLMHSSCW
jgi:hypothetical protein